MKNKLNIELVAFHKGNKPVKIKDEANFATFRTGNDFIVLPKKFVKNWDKLPEKVC